MYSILVYFSLFLALLLSTLYPIANAGINGISTFAKAVPTCAVEAIAQPPPPPPPDGVAVGVAVGCEVGVAVGCVVGVGVGVGGAKSSLFGIPALRPNLTKHAENGVQLTPSS